MNRNLTGFGAYGGDVADPRARVSTRILGRLPVIAASPTSSATFAPSRTPTATVPGSMQQQSITGPAPQTQQYPEQGYVAPSDVPPYQYPSESYTLPGEFPGTQQFVEEGDLVGQPSTNGNGGMDTKQMLALGLLAAAVLAGGYWFFVAKKPKKES
jgi:hypothetical protein